MNSISNVTKMRIRFSILFINQFARQNRVSLITHNVNFLASSSINSERERSSEPLEKKRYFSCTRPNYCLEERFFFEQTYYGKLTTRILVQYSTCTCSSRGLP